MVNNMCLVRILSRSGVSKDCYNYHFALPKFFFSDFLFTLPSSRKLTLFPSETRKQHRREQYPLHQVILWLGVPYYKWAYKKYSSSYSVRSHPSPQTNASIQCNKMFCLKNEVDVFMAELLWVFLDSLYFLRFLFSLGWNNTSCLSSFWCSLFIF